MVHEPPPGSFRPISPDGKVLIVGGRDSNYPKWVRRHPRIVIWYNTDPSTMRRTIPQAVEAILLTRFVKHKQVRRIIKIMPEGVRIVRIPINTGKIPDALGALGIR